MVIRPSLECNLYGIKIRVTLKKSTVERVMQETFSLAITSVTASSLGRAFVGVSVGSEELQSIQEFIL